MQISKHFTGSFRYVQISYFWRVHSRFLSRETNKKLGLKILLFCIKTTMYFPRLSKGGKWNSLLIYGWDIWPTIFPFCILAKSVFPDKDYYCTLIKKYFCKAFFITCPRDSIDHRLASWLASTNGLRPEASWKHLSIEVASI